LSRLPTGDLLGLERVVEVFAVPGVTPPSLDDLLVPRGLRLLKRVPQLSSVTAARLVERFGDLYGLVRASERELADVGGIDLEQARLVKEGIARLAETSILDRYS
jgi:diadenylate cyclase